MASRHALADVLDLQHRLPLTWAVCLRGECETWVARRIAKLSRHLSADKVGLVDSAMSRMIATESAGRVLEVAEAKIIEADPALHEDKREAERRSRFARLGRTDEFGLRMLIARLDAATRSRSRRPCAGSRRSSRPATPTPPPTSSAPSPSPGSLARPSCSPCSSSTPRPLPTRSPTPDARPRPGSRRPGRAPAFPADLLDALRDIDLTPLAPKAVLHVHLHEAALHGTEAVARIEGFGPVTLSRLTELLARSDLTHPAGQGPLPPGPLHRLRAPRVTARPGPPRSPAVTTGPTPPPPAATSTSTTPPPTTTVPAPAPAENPRRTRPAPTTPAHSADDTTAGRPTRATSHASAAKAATCGSPPTASRSSSTTPAPTASTPRKRE